MATLSSPLLVNDLWFISNCVDPTGTSAPVGSMRLQTVATQHALLGNHSNLLLPSPAPPTWERGNILLVEEVVKLIVVQ